MIRKYGELVSACATEDNLACVMLEQLPADVLDALATLMMRWPSLTTRHNPIRDATRLSVQREGKALLIRDVLDDMPQSVLLFPKERIARRFERLGEFCQSLSDLLLLREMSKSGEAELPLIFDPDQLGEDIGEALTRLRLRDSTLMGAAQELQAQLALVFNIRTVAQLVIKLSIILDSRLQIVCTDFQRALINAFWDWADANKLYVLYCLLARKGIAMSDQAFFLYYTKLLDRMTVMRQAGVDAVDNDGRLRLPLANDPLARAVPMVWWQQMSRRFERIKVEMGAELVSMQTEPPIWRYDG